jgi:phospholipase D1/2
MSRVLEPGATCSSIEDVGHARVLVDGEEYYAVLRETCRKASRYICMTGWQFDTRANLAPDEDEALRFLDFLNALCEENAELEVFVTAWNYSVVYAVEREWFQNVRFAVGAHERVHFRFLNHPEPGAAHHEKIVVVDGAVAFCGGLDVCDERWDSRRHLGKDPRRLSARETTYGPFHDVQLMLGGSVVGQLEEYFWQSWVQAGGEASVRPTKPTHVQFEPRGLLPERGLELQACRAALSRTRIEDDERFEIEELLLRAVGRAERFIYVENQYFTSKAFVKALITRMCDEARPKLDVVFVLPEGGHSKKEELVLGSRQRLMLWLVHELARTNGHRFRVLQSSSVDDEGNRIATYIHSKVMTIDDRFATIGSANLMNRSMRVDHELNVSFDVELCESEGQQTQLTQDLRRLTSSLLAEHAGLAEEANASEVNVFYRADDWIAVVDELCADPGSKLMPQKLERPKEDDEFFSALCDPAGPLNWTSIHDAVDSLFESDQTAVKGAARRVGQLLGVVDIEQDDKSAST